MWTLHLNGLILLSNALTRVEERLSVLVGGGEGYGKGESNGRSRAAIIAADIGGGGVVHRHPLLIPEHNGWKVTMWHFGVDAIVEYTGEKFSVTWKAGQSALLRVYSKEMKANKTRIRLERQECPNKTLAEAIEEKLNK
jgi:hypothetical protein